MADDQNPIPRTHTSNDMFWPIRAFKRFIQRIEPELIEQEQGGLEFTRAGLVKAVRSKSGTMQFGEIEGNSMMIERPGVGHTIDPAKALAHNRGFVYAAVNAKAREVMIIDWRLFEIDGKDHVEQPEHEALDLLDTVNDNMTALEFKYLISACLDLTGSAYIYLQGVKNDMDKPKALYLMPPDRVRPVIDRRTWPEQLIGYKMTRDNGDIAFKPYEVIQIRLPNPRDFFSGMSPVEAAATYIDNDDYAQEFNRKFFKNGARPAGFLESDFIAETQIESLKIGFAQMHQGVDNMNGIGVLPKGVKWVPNGSSPKDMDFKNLSEDGKERQLAIFGVSKTILGTAESDTNRATAETADYVFSKRVVKPHMTLICDALNQALIPRYGDNLYLTFLDPVPEDRAARTTEMQTSVGSQPVLTINEAREQFMGLGPVEGGDVLMSPTTMAPQGAPEGTGDATPQADTNTTPNKTFPHGELKAANGERVAFRLSRTKLQSRMKNRRAIATDLGASIAEQVKKALSAPKKQFSTPEQDEAAHKAIGDRATTAQTELIAALKALNADQQAEVLKNLRSATRKGVDPKKLFDLAAWVGFTIAAITPALIALYESESKNAADEIGKPDLAPLESEAAESALREDIATAAESYQQTTLDLLTAKINAGVDAGASLPDIKASVQEVYGYSDDVRAELVAKTEAFRTTNAALNETWKQSGVVKTVKWYTTSGDPCPFCQTMNGKTVATGGTFVKEGDTVAAGDASMTANYGDVNYPPLHPRCQCITRPDDVSL